MISPEFQAAMDKVDNATNKLAEGGVAISSAVDGVSIRFDALKGQIKTSMTAAEVADVKAKIDADTTKLDAAVLAQDAMVAALNSIGAEPTDPVPTPVPEPPVI